MDLYREFVVQALGVECDAALAWLAQFVAHSPAPAALALQRAAAHWQQADQPLRTALAAKLGFVEPNKQPLWPVPRAIQADYEAGAKFAMHVLT